MQALTWNTPESKHETVPEVCADTGRVIVGWIRLDNRAELCVQLGLELRADLTDPQLVLAAHRAWGEVCPDRIEGDFSFLIYDPARHTAFCARDALGVRPFFYHLSRELFVFASTAAVYPVLRRFDAAPSREWMARFLIGESADGMNTAYAQVKKLPPAHILSVAREGAAEPVRYFGFEDSAPQIWRRDARRVDAYRDAFHRAVEARLRSAWRIGAENSGGIDSATIIAHAVGQLPGGGANLPCFSLCHMEREPGYILDLAMHCGIKDNYVLARPAYQPETEIYERANRVLGYPPEHNHALLHVPFFERCQAAGIRTLLSGFGGDEIVTSQAEFLTRELFLAGRYAQLLNELPGNMATRAARAVAMFGTGLPKTRRTVPGGGTPRLARTILRREVIEDYGLTGHHEANVAAYRQARTLNGHLLAKPAIRTALIGRLEGCSLMAGSYRIDYRWPMLDRALIARFLATPSIEKRHRQWGRYLHRRACNGTVPDQILWKERKEMGRIRYFGRDRRLPAIDVDAIPAALDDIVDRGAVLAQVEMLNSIFDDGDLWLAKAPERNNLRALTTLDIWLNNHWHRGI
ncbi:asparagine synthase-related protein [Sphingomonas suaedae]|uniref:asparagine synthase-related protein n=1 Tax=Sphingomonas suaedae TaxID=2599297 RepID=UPI001645D277|nr:asparagine synthase-related protein [Sphingomonas suaedae]